MTNRSFLSMIALLALTMLVLSACSSASQMSIGPARPPLQLQSLIRSPTALLSGKSMPRMPVIPAR